MKPWESKGKAMLMVSHTTALSYADAVVEAHTEVRKTPVETPLQRVMTHKLDARPPPLGLSAETHTLQP